MRACVRVFSGVIVLILYEQRFLSLVFVMYRIILKPRAVWSFCDGFPLVRAIR